MIALVEVRESRLLVGGLTATAPNDPCDFRVCRYRNRRRSSLCRLCCAALAPSPVDLHGNRAMPILSACLDAREHAVNDLVATLTLSLKRPFGRRSAIGSMKTEVKTAMAPDGDMMEILS